MRSRQREGIGGGDGDVVAGGVGRYLSESGRDAGDAFSFGDVDRQKASARQR